jgi:large subunit ribosomal protein L21
VPVGTGLSVVQAQEQPVYAVIATGGKQYRVTPGDEVRVEKLDGDVGESVQLRPVLLVGDDGAVTAGPDLAGKAVTGTITGHGKGDKITVFTYKNKTRQHKKAGHRQRYTTVKVESV